MGFPVKRKHTTSSHLDFSDTRKTSLRSGASLSALALVLTVAGGAAFPARAGTYQASDQASLIAAINQANADSAGNSTITLTGSFSVAGNALPAITKALTIDAGPYTVSTTGNSAYDVAPGTRLTLNGDIDGNGSLTKNNSGTLVITGVGSAYTKNFLINAGQVRVESGGQLGVGNPTDLGLLVSGDGASVVVTGFNSKITSGGVNRLGSVTGSSLTIEAGGAFQSTNALNIADAAGATGTLNVRGVGSTFKSAGLSIVKGTGLINITDGAAMDTGGSGIGGSGAVASSGGSGTVVVSGAGSNWTTTQLGVFKGSLSVLDGGSVSSTYTRIAGTSGDNATVVVSGAGSKLVGTLNGGGISYTEVGGAGAGTLTIANQGAVTVGTNGGGVMRIATNAGGSGTLNIGAAPGQAATAAGALNAATIQFGAGAGLVNFNHTDANYLFSAQMLGAGAVNQIGPGATILTANNNYTGGTTIGAGTLQLGAGGASGGIVGNVTNNGALSFNRSDAALSLGGVISGSGAVDQIGAGATTLTGVNTYTGLTTIFAGTLALSGGGGVATSSRVHADGVFDISATTAGASIKSLSGGGLVKLGAQTLTLTNAFSTFAGAIQGTGGLTLASGSETLSGANTYAGATQVGNGMLIAGATNTFSAASATTVSAGGTLALRGFDQNVASLDNAGLVSLGGAPGTTLTVAGGYVGSGGALNINTRLGGDASPTDLLRVQGDTSGTSTVKVVNLGGDGAETVEGIKVIDVAGASNGVFSLLGDYAFHGQQAVIAGAYAYTLQKNGVANPADGDWYLRSSLVNPPPVTPPVTPPTTPPTTPPEPVTPPTTPPTPIYQPGVPLYEVHPQVLFALNGLPTLQQRVGDRYWQAGAVHTDAAPLIDQPGAGQSVVWARTEGSYIRSAASGSASVSSYDIGQWKARIGIDSRLYDSQAGMLIGGLTAHYGQAIADVRSTYGDGRVTTTGGGVGGTLTWYGADGFYMDGQAQATFFDSDLKSKLIGRNMASSVGAVGYALSIETGRRFGIDGPWALTPQAQLVYAAVDTDFLDRYGAKVSLDHDDRLTGRLGLALDHQTVRRDDAGKLVRANVYGIANAYYEFRNGAGVNVAGTDLASRVERLAAGFGGGGAYNWNNDRYSIFGEVLIKTSFNDDYSVGGTGGFRMRW